MALPPNPAAQTCLALQLYFFIILYPPYGVWRCCRLQLLWTSWTRGYVLLCMFATCFGYFPGFILANVWFFTNITNKHYDRLYSWNLRNNQPSNNLNGPNSFFKFLCCSGCEIFKDTKDECDQ
jgi:hypothetical protein